MHSLALISGFSLTSITHSPLIGVSSSRVTYAGPGFFFNTFPCCTPAPGHSQCHQSHQLSPQAAQAVVLALHPPSINLSNSCSLPFHFHPMLPLHVQYSLPPHPQHTAPIPLRSYGNTSWILDVTFLGLRRVHFLFSTCLLSLSHHVTNHPSISIT